LSSSKVKFLDDFTSPRNLLIGDLQKINQNTIAKYMKNYYVYILTNKKQGILYVGITNNLERRIYEYKNKKIKGFTEKYNLDKLAFYEDTSDVSFAIQREKQLKKWNRQWKIDLIEKDNPEWIDLASSWYGE